MSVTPVLHNSDEMISGDLLSACPHRQFHTLPGLLDSQAALSDFYPNALRAKQGGSLYHFYDGLWYDPAGRRTHDLPGHSMPNHPKSEKFPGWPSQILMKIGSNAHLRIWWPHAKKFCHLAISFIFIVTYIQGGGLSYFLLTMSNLNDCLF